MALWARSVSSTLMLGALACSSRGDAAPDAPPGGPGPAAPTPTEVVDASAPIEAAPPAPVVPAAEVGFVDVPAQVRGAQYAGRMFYSFRAAKENPASKPLFVFFNGGPGGATTAGLAALGTGPVTIDTDLPLDAPLKDNPTSMNDYANLLYIDERQVGFSYGFGTPVDPSECVYDADSDAADFMRVVFAFLQSHSALAKNEVTLVGESYGGTRAILINYMLLHASEDRARSVGLEDLLQAHQRAAFGAVDPSPAAIAKQFGHLVLIQPMLIGTDQLDGAYEYYKDNPDIPTTPYDPYDVRKDDKFEGEVLSPRLVKVVSDPALVDRLFGISLGTAEQMKPAARKGAWRVAPAETSGTASSDVLGAAEKLFTNRFGALEAGDHYYNDFGRSCRWQPNATQPAPEFLDIAKTTKIFITNARYDTVCYGPAIVPLLKKDFDLDSEVDTTPVPGVARPGHLVLHPATGPAIKIRFPKYESGHMVAASASAALYADVKDWLAE